MEIDTKELEISNFKAKFIGEDDNSDNDEASEDIDIKLNDLIEFINDKKEVSMYDLKVKFKATKNRQKDKDRASHIFNLIQKNKHIIKWNGESKNKARYYIEDNQPIITEFNEEIYDTESLTSIFGE